MRRAEADLPDSVYTRLVSKLFEAKLTVLVSSALGVALVGGVASWQIGDVWLAALTAVGAVMSAALIILLLSCPAAVVKADPQVARRAERSYILIGCISSTGIGAACARALLATDDATIHLMLVAVTLGAVSSVLRNYFRPPIVLLQFTVLLLPPMVAMVWRNHPLYWALALGGVFLIYNMIRIAIDLYGQARDSFTKDDELHRQNLRFDAALNNMVQGLCMFDASLTLTVFNQRFLDLYGLSPDFVVPGVTLRQLVEHSVARGNHPTDSVDEIYNQWIRQVIRSGTAQFHRTLPDGRTLAISHQPLPEGGRVATFEDITEAKRAAEQASHLARHDVLTNLPNRLYLRDRMTQALSALKAGHRLAVMCLDLDEFKAVNDTHGHPAGDALLLEVASRLTECLGTDDFLARLGGDEFAALLPITHEATAQEVGARIVAVVAEPFSIGGRQARIGTSIGIAIAPEHGIDADTLLKRADIALYQAKSGGRGIVRLFDPAMAERLTEQRALEAELREATSRGEFELFYQPLVALKSGAISGFEALIRWHHPGQGLLNPDRFIPLAEATGLIVPLGDWVLKEACAEAARWPDHLKVAVNLSPDQFRSKTLVRSIMLALASSGLPPHRLEIEVTENVLLEDSDAKLNILRQIRDMGVSVALDDFGTGYSSLSYLRSFPFDKVKIDKSFVSGTGAGIEGAAIIRAVTGLCNSLGIVTSVEGIETDEQLARIRAEGCTEAQGFLFGGPQPAHELPRAFPALFSGARPRAVQA